MDGIDATVIKSDGIKFQRTGFSYSKSYEANTLKLLSEAIKNPLDLINDKYNYLKLSNLITVEHAKVVKKLILKIYNNNHNNIKPSLIGFHGQTILHDPKEKLSIQLGDGKLLSELTGLNVVSDFRKNDIKKGGQGAPLAPIFHLSILKQLKQELPAAILNLGGVGNITWYDGKTLIGFDTGPANGLMDIFIQKKKGELCDLNGRLAKKGSPNNKIIEKVLSHKFFKANFPKSLDRLTFDLILDDKKFLKLSINDALSTLAHITIRSLALSLSLLPKPPLSLIIVGGGQYNKYIVENIKKTHPFKINTAHELGLLGNMIEAELMAFLAIRSVKNLPFTFLQTTGVIEPSSGGVLHTN